MSPSPLSLPTDLPAKLLKQAPGQFECVFVNCELHNTPGGMTASADFFALTRKLFGGYVRNQITLDLESVRAMSALGERLMSEHSTEHLTVDVVIEKSRAVHAFLDLEQLPRLKGGDDFYARKHEQYIQAFPVLRHAPARGGRA
ncbi:hypothetical protein [Ideonella paludis]|uniref:Uncharacterized protein n=1 Tax=Ideonella paludis TaxID=1233411 RepID=A0ABS5DYZ5_9BURK|nr:hypothetical protein [Ideonella paludis]MBQ0936378.1 hypothetical protein [Ideonella paludis]